MWRWQRGGGWHLVCSRLAQRTCKPGREPDTRLSSIGSWRASRDSRLAGRRSPRWGPGSRSSLCQPCPSPSASAGQQPSTHGSHGPWAARTLASVFQLLPRKWGPCGVQAGGREVSPLSCEFAVMRFLFAVPYKLVPRAESLPFHNEKQDSGCAQLARMSVQGPGRRD